MVSLLISLFVAFLNSASTNASPFFKLSSRAQVIPQFVKDFAPVVFLDKEEQYYPADIARHIENTAPFITLNAIDPAPAITVDNLETLNTLGNQGDDVFLTSKEIVKDKPAFFTGTKPDNTGMTVGATSCVTIVSDHGDGIVDAFYMYFFSYNQGNTVLFHELGDHVGDWEHNMIRFKNGVPEAVWFSQHSGGQAFAYSGLEKEGNRPVYPKGKKGQENLFTFRKYVDGPTGPRNKNLNRVNVCPDKTKYCKIRVKAAP
ncbi:putative vacuolar protein sorting-associated protein TDA6 [Golovinomyces cichoracearum]|uniref:Putative vacuolar protein sorting-associated protein TDA6 n=1 Tax=Golovinomyces cichoracearum TaxID=62708 RepID=A0A420IMX3_9PEZI|nr:putative vacuolar protein sorting-associated protein TDA6 [Golovinomyces cichoracearum]